MIKWDTVKIFNYKNAYLQKKYNWGNEMICHKCVSTEKKNIPNHSCQISSIIDMWSYLTPTTEKWYQLNLFGVSVFDSDILQ